MAECIAPGTVSDEALAAYMVNPHEVEPAIADHLTRCPSCQSEVARMRSLTPVLGQRLRRVDCPSVEQLDAYLASETRRAETEPLTAHLKECLRCQQEIEEMQAALMPSAPPPDSRSERMILFATRLFTPHAPRLAWQARGAGEGNEPLIFTAGHLTLVLAPGYDEQGQVRILGRFEGLAADESPPPVVRLFSLTEAATVGSSPTAEALVDADGEFILGPVPRGSYQIEILLPDRVFVVGSALVLHRPSMT